ncbi:hypothetical protein [Mycobacterium aquaticum]|uniref:Uncharacterized protein n=1 Tax=Mycobacterium aquaticum TaxID=1927124 RepID=A0A1X0ABF7_9MYCO|nr:hypothetical protein [Mycobacterium aquaticum]ORA27379.1 hypothetical protein BST13_30440 [Mycobacterium aquaticum]
MNEYSEDLDVPELPAWAEAYLARERAWWRLLRGTGAVTPEEATAELLRWVQPRRRPRGV